MLRVIVTSDVNAEFEVGTEGPEIRLNSLKLARYRVENGFLIRNSGNQEVGLTGTGSRVPPSQPLAGRAARSTGAGFLRVPSDISMAEPDLWRGNVGAFQKAEFRTEDDEHEHD
jgi:hypothetical protein